MMKPITLVGLLCLLTPPLLTGQAQGAEPSTSAATATSGASAPAQPEVAAQPSAAAPSSAAAPAPAAVQTTATPAANPSAPVAAASATPAAAPAAAPIPAPVAAEGDRSPNNRPMTSTPASGLTVDSGALQAVPLYRQDELLNWIEQGRTCSRSSRTGASSPRISRCEPK